MKLAFATSVSYISTTYILNSMIFTTKNNELAIFGKTLTETKGKLIGFFNAFERGGIKGQEGIIDTFFSKDKKTLLAPKLLKDLENFKNDFNYSSLSAEALAEQYEEIDQRIIEYAKTCKNGEMTTKGFIASMDTMSFSAKAGKAALSALVAAGNMIAFSLIAEGISFAAKKFNEYIHAAETARKKSIELTDSWVSENDSINDSISKYQELKEKLNDTSLSSSEIKNIKENLLDIQTELIDKYGQEALGIDLVNGKYEEQISKLKNLSRQKAQNFVAENYSNVQEDKQYLNEKINLNQSLGFSGTQARPDDYSGSGFDLGKYLNKYDKLDAKVIEPSGQYGLAGTVGLVTNGTREEVYNQLSQLFNDLSNDFGDSNKDVNKIKKILSDIIQNSFDTEQIEKSKSNIKNYAEAEILSQDNTRELYDDATNAVDTYNDALSSGHGIDDAKKNLDDIKSKVKSNTSNMSDAEYLFNDIFSQVNSTAEKSYELSNKFNNDNSIQEQAEQLKGLSEDDLLKINFEDDIEQSGEKAFSALMDIIGLSNDEIQLLIDKLVELGYVQSSTLSDENTSSTPKTFQESWDSLGTTGNDDTKQATQEAKEQLLELAEAGKLTAEELLKSPAGKTIMEQTKLSAEEASEAVTKLAGRSSQLSSIKSETQTISTPLSFSDAWKQLEDGNGVFADDESINNTHNNLLELAKTGQLTAKTLQETDGADTFLEQIGIGAEEAAEKIQNMLSTQEKLGAFSQGLSGLSSAFEEFQENEFVSAETLNSLPDAFKSLKGYDVFSQIVGDPTSGTQKIQDAFDQIVTEYMQSQHILDDATSQNKNQIIANLQQAGIGNAEDLVNSYVKSVEENKPLIQGASDEILQYLSNNNEADVNNFITALQSKNANYTELSSALGEDNAALLAKFGSQYGDDLANWITLLQQKEEAYNQFVQEYNDSLDGQQNYFDELDMPVERAVANGTASTDILTQNANKVSTAKQNMDNAEKDLEETKQDTTKKYTKKLSKIQAKINVSDYQPKSPAQSNDNKNSAPKETKQSFDWLERRISVLTSNLDLLKSKIENVFSVKKKNSFINDEIKNTKALIKTYKQQAKTYKAQAKKSAKSEETTTGNDKSKLTGKKGKKLKKQIQTGQIKGSKKQWIQEYGEKTANAIEEYQNYWDKYQEALTNVQSARTTKRELKIQKHQNKLDKFDAKTDKYDAKIENATTASAKNTLEDKKLTSTKSSYNQQIKIAEKEYGKNSPQVAKLKAEKKTAVRDIKIEKQQNLQDEADAYKDLLDAQIENASEAKEKNSLLQQQQAYITNSYNAQIKIANLEGNMAKKEELKIKKQKELLENEKQQLQNLSDEQSAQYDLNQQRESNANSAKEKNKFETASRENLKSQYKYEIEIAKKNGDTAEAERLQLELNEKIEESYQRQIDNLKEEYDLTIGLNDAKKSTINSQIAALQANGYSIAADLYLEQQEIDLTNYQDTLSKIRDITAEMQNLDPESQAYQNYLIELESYKQEAWGYQQAWAETQQAINDINLSKIEHVGTLLGYQANQLEHIQNILGHNDFTLSAKDGGGLTMEGLASVAVTFRQMQNNNDQVANKKAQLEEINRQIDAKEYVGSKEQAEEEIYNLIKEIEELEESNYDFGESIKNMVIDSLNSLSDALDENIAKYKDTLKTQKDLFDYRKKMVNQLKSIASLEKQLAALEGSDTEEARARIQKLQIQLEEEQENLNEIQYDKYIQDQEELLDKVSDDFQDFIANVTNMSVAKICEAMSKIVADNQNKISKTITDAFADSTAISSVADSMTGLKNVMENIDYSTKITLNINSNGVPTSMTVDGKEVTVPKQDDGVNDTANDIENASADNGNTELKQSIEKYIQNLSKYVSVADAGMSLSIDPLNQFLHTEHGKMATSFEKYQILKKLGLLQNGWGDEKNPKILVQAVEKLQHLGFSQGGIATHLNRIALANGDDGWATLKRGESVLTPAQTKQFQKLTNNLVPLNTIAEAIASLSANPTPTNHSPAAAITTIHNMDIHLDGSHVIDADSFIQTLHNPRVLQKVSSGVSSQLGNIMSNKLGTF